MRRLPAFVFLTAAGLVLAMMYLAVGDGSSTLYAQSDGEKVGATIGEGAANAGRPDPALCTQCFQKLQKDNRDCETLTGQDWQIWREAAETAYRQCSHGC